MKKYLIIFCISTLSFLFLNLIPTTKAATDTVNLTTDVTEYLVLEVTTGDTINFGNLTPGVPAKGSNGTQINVTTSASNGYKLYINDDIASTNSALVHTDTTTYITDYAGTITTPTSWTGTGLGFSLYSGTNKDAKWGTGTTYNDANNKYAGIPENSTEIMDKTGYSATADSSYIGWELDVPNNQKTGDYTGSVTVSATASL